MCAVGWTGGSIASTYLDGQIDTPARENKVQRARMKLKGGDPDAITRCRDRIEQLVMMPGRKLQDLFAGSQRSPPCSGSPGMGFLTSDRAGGLVFVDGLLRLPGSDTGIEAPIAKLLFGLLDGHSYFPRAQHLRLSGWALPELVQDVRRYVLLRDLLTVLVVEMPVLVVDRVMIVGVFHADR